MPPADRAGQSNFVRSPARFPESDAWQVPPTSEKDFVTPDGIRVAPALSPLRTLI
jgi:hypothetical protein